MNVPEFIAKWRRVELKERSAAQEHFLDLCALFDHPTPAAADPTGETFCFEKGAAKHGGGDGFADVWKRDHFGWEYKGRHKDLDAAYDQLLRYRNALANPPLLAVCDFDRIIVHTNFTGTVSSAFEIPLESMGEPRNLEVLRAVFFDPEKLKPGRTSEAITEDAAERLARIAEAMRGRGQDPAAVAHFLNRLIFCLFAEDIGLLPDMIFTRIVEKSGGDPERFGKLLGQLFEAMAHGGDFGLEAIRHFNGNLFESAEVLPMTVPEMTAIFQAAGLDWGTVDPSIFGTLFERGLDPAKRSQLGAHYTSREDIETLVEPVVLAPLRCEWTEVRATVGRLLATGRKEGDPTQTKAPAGAALRKARGEADAILHAFLVRLQGLRVLDPACGSGNFLYVTLQKLKDLEKEVIVHAMDLGFGGYLPMVGPWQLHGIELNPYAHDLAQTSVWIGFFQWTRANGFHITQDPVLRPMRNNFRCMDAILAGHADASCRSAAVPAASSAASECGRDARAPAEPEWPAVDFIVGNPPFLGGKMLRRELGDDYVDRLLALWKIRVPAEADLCCYWFEKARAHIAAGKCKRAGLLATQGIRGGANREVLKRIKESGDIFWAQSDRPWVLDGANVHVSMVGFGGKEERADGSAGVPPASSPSSHGGRDARAPAFILDGKPVVTINANLTANADIGAAVRLPANLGIGFMGTTKQGPFDITESLALEWLPLPNPHGLPNSDVLAPWINGMAVTKRMPPMWIIDFFNKEESAANRFETPFAYALEHVKRARDAKPRDWYRAEWWQLYAQRPEMRKALAPHRRFVVTPTVAKHRLFSWLDVPINPDHQLIVFARSDDYFFGVLHSRLHEVWALRMGTRLETRPRYTPTTCFETFPFPEPDDGQRDAIGRAAAELNALRERWLNPPEWTREEVLEFPGTVGGPWDRFIVPGSAGVLTASHCGRDARAPVGTVRYPRLVAKDAECAGRLKKRTLTNLYNERPAWLANAHAALDAAVCAAYGWPSDLTDAAILERLLAINLERAGKD